MISLYTGYGLPSILILFSVSNLLAILTGFYLKNKYTMLSAERAINTSISNEIIIGLLITITACYYSSFNLYIFTGLGKITQT